MLVYPTSPRLPPCTVTDPDPVAPLFVCDVVLVVGLSFVYIVVDVPPAPPAVIETLLDARAPEHVLLLIIVSEIHFVASVAVPPPLALGLPSLIPIFDPRIETTADPVDNLFVLSKPLNRALLIEKPPDAVPTRPPEVNTIIL